VPPRSTPIVSRGLNSDGAPAAACASIDIPCLRREMIGRPSGPGVPRAAGSPAGPRSPAGPGLRGKPERREEARVHGLWARRTGRPEAPGTSAQEAGGQGPEAPVHGLQVAPQPARPDPQAEPAEHPRRRGPRRHPRVLLAADRRQAALAPLDPDLLVGWLLLSFISFAISAQIQKGKLPQSAKDALKGGPAVLAGQNILILGGDRRGKTQHNAKRRRGRGPPRADTIMVLHASLTVVPQALHPA